MRQYYGNLYGGVFFFVVFVFVFLFVHLFVCLGNIGNGLMQLISFSGFSGTKEMLTPISQVLGKGKEIFFMRLLGPHFITGCKSSIMLSIKLKKLNDRQQLSSACT